MALVKTIKPFDPATQLGNAVEIRSGYNTATRYRSSFEFTATSDAQVAIATVPARALVTRVEVKCKTAGTIDTGTHLSVGHGSDLDAIGIIDFTSIDATNDAWMPLVAAPQYFAAATVVHANSTNSSAAAAGTLETGTWGVVIEYEIVPQIEDYA